MANYRRAYGYCAKCGETKGIDSTYVHEHCKSPRKKGGFHYCAVCGKAWVGSHRTDVRDYVCTMDLVRVP